MVLARFVLLAAVLLAASSVSAAVTIDLGPSDWRRWGDGTSHHHTNGLNRKFGQTIRMPPMNTNLTVTRNAVVPYGSIANGAKNFLRINPASVAASAALTGLFLAVDWVFDQATGEWRKEGELVPIPPDPDAYRWVSSVNQAGPYFTTPEDACQYVIDTANANAAPGYVYHFEYVRFTSSTSAQCRGPREQAGSTIPDVSNGGVVRLGNSCPEGSSWNEDMRACVMPSGLVPLSQSDWDHFESSLPGLPAPAVGDATHDIQRQIGSPLPGYTDIQMEGPSSVTGTETTTTTTDPVTGDTVVTNTQTTTNIQYGDTTITTTNTTTSNTYVNGNHTKTETTTETPGELTVTEPSAEGAAEWPGFCEWATIVCDFIEWFQEPFEEPDVQWPEIVDEDFQEEFSYVLQGQCPEPYTISLSLFPPVQFNWQPFCDLATFIRPLVLASAAIFAAFISLGIARART